MKSPASMINCIIAIQLLIITVLLPLPAASQPSPPPPPWGSDRPNTYYGTMNPRVGLIVLVATVVIFFTAFFCLFARSCCVDESSNSLARRLSTVRRGNRGLNSDVIDSFPTFDYSAVKALKIGKGALECAVCLSEFEDDESLRLIPKCDHLFHTDCIDLWLASHATCPVCRAYLVPDPGEPVNASTQAGAGNQNDDVAIDVASQSGGSACESMERPLNPPRLIRSRTRGSLNRWSSVSGRRRWFGLFARSYSTGHVAVASENVERFTLRVPEEIRRQIISGKLSRTTSCVAPSPTEGSSRRGNRIGLGSGQALNY